MSSALSLPNILTYCRLAIVPVVVGLLLYASPSSGHTNARWIAEALYIIAAITDFFDGYFARRWKLHSSLGRMLDPIADKVLISAILLVLAAEGTIAGWNLWAAIIILSREVLVSGLREYLAELRVSVPVTQVAKWKTTAQLFAVGLLIIGPAENSYFPWVTEIGLVFLWIAAALTLYTGYDYFRAGLRHIID